MIQALPLASIAIADGVLRPPPVNGEPDTGEPTEFRTLTLLLPALVTQRLPPASTAEADGVLKAAVLYLIERVKSEAEARVGWKGERGAVKAMSEATLLAGYLEIFNAAPMVSVGAEPPPGVVYWNKEPQLVPSFAAPPPEFTQEAMMSARRCSARSTAGWR